MDHLGIVAGVCQELGIAERIDEKIGKKRSDRKLSCGTSAVAMIINGLGFTNRRLYLTSQFFESKATELLLGEGIKSEDITDSTLGQALDEIADYGSSTLFSEIAYAIAKDKGLLGGVNHLDSTSISVQGDYKNKEGQAEEDVVLITHGYSKDKRADLKQVMINLVVNGPAELPLWMESLSGNTSDQTSFRKTIKQVNEFEKQLKASPSLWVADAAFYTEENLKSVDGSLWISRVPESIKEAKTYVNLKDDVIDWIESDSNGYKYATFSSHYADIEQRWLLVFSEQAYNRESVTFEKKLKKQEVALEKALWHMRNSLFNCKADAENALQKLAKKHPLFTITFNVVEKHKYEKAGRPAKKAKKQTFYQLQSKLTRNDVAITTALNSKGRFILASNNLDTSNLPNMLILSEYKAQSKAESGFRFIKNPDFMVDSIFLKKPKRIQALMVIMTLCLFVYNYAQHKLRTALQEHDLTIPNQKKKPIQNPTLKWAFQLMEGVAIVSISSTQQALVTNMSSLRSKIVALFGNHVSALYAVNSNSVNLS